MGEIEEEILRILWECTDEEKNKIVNEIIKKNPLEKEGMVP